MKRRQNPNVFNATNNNNDSDSLRMSNMPIMNSIEDIMCFFIIIYLFLKNPANILFPN